MIVKTELSWLRMLFQIRGTVLARTFPRIAAATGFAVVVTFVELKTPLESYSLTVTPFTLIGTALAIILGFRTNAAYDRFWEGRKLWGQMVNSARSFAREVLTLIDVPDEHDADRLDVRTFQHNLIHRMIAYTHALRYHLRGGAPFDEIARHLPGEEVAKLQAEKNVPNAILLEIGRRLHVARKHHWISDYHLGIFERTLTDITNLQGGCERIKNTPIPFGYTLLIHRIVAFYCFFLPFGIVKTVGWLTPVVVALISHAFFGLDDIGDEIESPFGTEPQHLPLTALCRTIEVNLLQSIDADEVPEMMMPVAGILE